MTKQTLRLISIISLGFNLLASIWIGVNWRSLPGKVPLYYSRPWGEDQLADKTLLVLPAVLGLTVTLICWATARLLIKKEDKFLAAIVAGTSIVFSVIILIAIVRNISLVI